MIRLGWRLVFTGGREALTRLALITIAVAVGVGLLLTTLGGLNAVKNQNARYAWLETGYVKEAAVGAATTTPVWWWLRADYFHGTVIGRIDVAETGASSPVPPGLHRLPRPGEFYASPALARLLRTTPDDQLGSRYPGHLVGTIGSVALPSPDALLIVIGRTAADVAQQGGPHGDAHLVNRISTTTPSSCNGGDCLIGVGTNHNGIVLILAVVAAALLFPVLVFIGGATRLSAARREQRFAAMRLVGAAPRQIATIATVESTVATVAGIAAGFGVFWALRPAVARIPFTGSRFFTTDLSLSLPDVLFVVIGVPVGAAVSARLALRRVTISPLGVTRRVTPRPPSAWRLTPLLAGLGELTWFAYVHDIGVGTNTNTTLEAVLFLSGVLIVMWGLVVAGPWLTMMVSRLVVLRARRPSTLIAGRRIADNPKAAFRAISGVVLAVFVGTCASAIITTISAGGNNSGGLGSAAPRTLLEPLWDRDRPHPPTRADTRAVQNLKAISGVSGVVVVRNRTVSAPGPSPELGPPMEELVSCAELAQVPALGRCAPGATTAIFFPDYGGGFGIQRSRPMAQRVWPTSDVTDAQLRTLDIDTILVATDGSQATVERARTTLGAAYPLDFPPRTSAELDAEQSRLLDDYTRLADVVMLTSLPIAGCSLAVSVVGGLIERKRPFSLLRLSGAPVRMLRRVIGFEAAAPLLITTAVSTGVAFLAAQLFLRAQLHRPLIAPGLGYVMALGTGLLASLAVVASTLPLLERVSGPQAARND